jgi:hypothetical protein
LKKSCKATVKQDKPAPASLPETEQQNETNQAAEGDKPTSKKVAFATEATELPTYTLISEEKRKRAKRILKVLRGKVQPQDV